MFRSTALAPPDRPPFMLNYYRNAEVTGRRQPAVAAAPALLFLLFIPC